MKLSHELGKIFEQGIEKVIQMEIDDPDYLPQRNYDTCEQRAEDMVKDACVSVIKTLALSIATHRNEKHDENHNAEIGELSIDLSPEEIEIGTRSWWNS
jgi:hypothetical protein